MARGRQQSQWALASTMMALIANVNRDPSKSKPFVPADFDPFSSNTTTKPVKIKAPITALKDVFIDKKMPDLSCCQVEDP